ncbi:glycosyltransferase [Vibrio cholerae]|uniref:glycosyltransferase n=2 Tax=Vibrio paracholerae TaxID=650003 RepID=UPI000D33E9BF|nr:MULTISPECIES: glycosyltransferase [Vibrio]EGR0542543.1 glycosyltransferase [Vibrio cholerae]EGR0605018.1 glycosyltransferase [Vibrio cholerae]EGR1074967.1 glycosyltransferase [Vibrio cholerae]EGR2434932.1 glycosyltransferase [Vibrio cholerae]EGR3933881.1 glycosyltransferase [Vibrio cholerae]
MSKFKILIHTHSLPITGGSKSLLLLADLLVNAGHKVELILEKDNVKILPKNKIKINIISNFMTYVKSDYYLPNIKESNRTEKISTYKVNVFEKYPLVRKFLIYTRYLKNLLLWYGKKHGVKKLISKNKYDFVITNNMYNDLEHIFYYDNVNKIMSIRNSPEEVFTRRIQPKLFSFDRYFKNINFVCVSKDSESELRKITDRPTSTIYNPFDFSYIRLKSNEILPIGHTMNKKYFLIVGSLCKRKRVDIAIKSFSRLNHGDEYKLLIIGDGEEKSNLKVLVDNLGVSENVFFLGNQENPYSYMKNAMATLLTSESEGLPRVLVESLIVGTPVISSDCPTGPRELLGSESKYLVKMGDEVSMVNGFSAIMDDAIKFGIEQNICLDRFDPTSILHQWELIFKKMKNEK